MTEDRQKEYARLLREGNTREATELVSDNSQNQEKEDEEVVEETEVEDTQEEEDGQAVSEEERFAELNGVGPELADELVEQFGTFDEFVESAEPSDLEPVPGIGEKRAESLVEQAE